VSDVRFAMLAAALFDRAAVLLIQSALGTSVDATAIAVGGGSSAALVLLRLMGVIHALDRLRANERLARAEAETAQRLLTEQNERLREADRLKDEFVALISHDLRTPLTSITGYVELALEDDLSDDLRGYLQVVARNAERLLALVNDLLFVARLQAGEMSLEPGEVDLTKVVRDGVPLDGATRGGQGVTLTCAGRGRANGACRPRPRAAAARQPRLECDQVHAGRRVGARLARAARRSRRHRGGR
jgi:signal transduction histidine kinase